jgi:hypothetical protein
MTTPEMPAPMDDEYELACGVLGTRTPTYDVWDSAIRSLLGQSKLGLGYWNTKVSLLLRDLVPVHSIKPRYA